MLILVLTKVMMLVININIVILFVQVLELNKLIVVTCDFEFNIDNLNNVDNNNNLTILLNTDFIGIDNICSESDNLDVTKYIYTSTYSDYNPDWFDDTIIRDETFNITDNNITNLNPWGINKAKELCIEVFVYGKSRKRLGYVV